MRREDLLKLPSMPAAGPSYPAGPYRFINREFLVISYETDPELIRAGLPEPLQPLERPLVHYDGSRCRTARVSAATPNPVS
jgi:acetoacetate decarboxylase